MASARQWPGIDSFRGALTSRGVKPSQTVEWSCGGRAKEAWEPRTIHVGDQIAVTRVHQDDGGLSTRRDRLVERVTVRTSVETESTVVQDVHMSAGVLRAVTSSSGKRSPFLEGCYAPVDGEIEAEALRVEGVLPGHLRGAYLRNGPNPRFPPRGRYHWFDGDGMVHAVVLDPTDARSPARYRCRYVRTAGFVEEERAGRSLFPGLLEWPRLSRVVQGRDGYKNAANTAFLWNRGQLWALWEGGRPHRLDPRSLATLDGNPLPPGWQGAFTAHPKIDPSNGDVVFFGYSPIRPYLRLGILDRQGSLQTVRDVDLPRSVMLHDFAITPDYAVFLDMPQTFSWGNVLRGRGVFGWRPELGGRLGLVPRRGGEPRWFPISPGSVFHTLNAWQTGNVVTLIACRMPRFPSETLSGVVTQPAAADQPRLWRYDVDLDASRVTEGPLDDPGSEMPRMRDDLIGQPTRFAYTLRTDFRGWRKHDLRRGTTLRLDMPEGWTGGEAVFVPAPTATDEDQGHLLAFVQPPADGPAELWVIDARGFEDDPVARIHLPRRVPAGFHGCWIDA